MKKKGTELIFHKREKLTPSPFYFLFSAGYYYNHSYNIHNIDFSCKIWYNIKIEVIKINIILYNMKKKVSSLWEKGKDIEIRVASIRIE